MTTLNADTDVIVHLSAPETATYDVIIVIQHGRHSVSDDRERIVYERPLRLDRSHAHVQIDLAESQNTDQQVRQHDYQ